MKGKATLYIAGKVFDEVVQARDYQDAKEVALRRNSKNIDCFCDCCLLSFRIFS